MSTPDHTPSSRRSPYQIFSDKVFALTGMPVGRVLTVIIGLLVLGWAILYALRGDDQTAEYKSRVTKKQDFLAAITIPNDFFDAAFPVQVEKLDVMIGRCEQLLEQKSEYGDRVQEKLLTLLGLKSIALAEIKLDPTPTLALLQKNADQFSASLTPKDKYQYLVASSYMGVLAANPDLDLRHQATEAISAIQTTTPIPRSQAIVSFQSAMQYYEGSENKVEAAELVRLLGNRMSMAKDPSISDYGFSLIDYTYYYSSYNGSISQSKVGDNLESEVTQLVRQLQETPPQSQKTYKVLMNVPEQLLHSGNKKVALMVVQQLASAASSSPSLVRDNVLPKLAKLKTRVDLLRKPFPLTGFDITGEAIGPPKSEQTIIIFFNHQQQKSIRALRRVVGSPLREGWSTKTYLVPVGELPEQHILGIKELDPELIIVDGPTSKDWLEKSGIEQVPYVVRLDKAGIVELLSFP